MGQASDSELNHRVAHTEGLQASEIGHHRQAQGSQGNGCINADLGLKVFGAKSFSCQIIDALAEGL
jgi:hypothetical protein